MCYITYRLSPTHKKLITFHTWSWCSGSHHGVPKNKKVQIHVCLSIIVLCKLWNMKLYLLIVNVLLTLTFIQCNIISDLKFNHKSNKRSLTYLIWPEGWIDPCKFNFQFNKKQAESSSARSAEITHIGGDGRLNNTFLSGVTPKACVCSRSPIPSISKKSPLSPTL